MYRDKQGISGVITMLIIIALVLVAIGAVWYVVQNVLQEGQAETEQGLDDLFGECPADKITTVDGTCDEGEEVRMVNGEYCCVV